MILIALFTLAFLALAYGKAAAKSSDPSERRHLKGMSQLLGGGHDLGGDVAWGESFGAPTTIRFSKRSVEGEELPWTEIVVKLPRGYPMALRAHRLQASDVRALVSGEADRLHTGDAAFDESFFVEGAPLAVVKILLDHEARDFLRHYRHVELLTREGELSLSLQGWLRGEVSARPALELANRIAAQLPEAYARAERENEDIRGGSPFRSEPDAELTQALVRSQRAEVVRLQKKLPGTSLLPPVKEIAAVSMVVLGVLALMTRACLW